MKTAQSKGKGLVIDYFGYFLYDGMDKPLKFI